MNVTKIMLTTCQIFRLKCTKFNFGWGSAPDPAGETYVEEEGEWRYFVPVVKIH